MTKNHMTDVELADERARMFAAVVIMKANAMTKGQLIKALVATYDSDEAGWARFYSRWNAEDLRHAFAKRVEYIDRKASVAPTFDPDEALRKIRNCVDVTDTIKALDQWISSGGSLPRAWGGASSS